MNDYWTCTRVTGGVRCGAQNVRRAKKKAANMPLEQVNFGAQTKAPPRRVNDRGHGTEGATSMQDQSYGERQCAVEECAKPPKRVGKYFDRYCSMHRARVTRHHDPHAVNRPAYATAVHTNGYVIEHRPDHPLAMKNGRVYVHRAVLYDAIGGGDHVCHWCGSEVRWGARGPAELVPDHLDNTKTNNVRENLVTSCRPCNTRRSARKPVDLAVLYRMADAGVTRTEIARVLGVERRLISKRLKERA